MSASGLQVPQLLAQSSDFRLGGLASCHLAPDLGFSGLTGCRLALEPGRILPVIAQALAGVRIVQPELQAWLHAEVQSQQKAAAP